MQYKDSLVILCQVCISQDTEQSINKSNDDHNSLFKALSIVKKICFYWKCNFSMHDCLLSNLHFVTISL